jgi:predicted  nucleic acid-binding Zn-ribbon protein
MAKRPVINLAASDLKEGVIQITARLLQLESAFDQALKDGGDEILAVDSKIDQLRAELAPRVSYLEGAVQVHRAGTACDYKMGYNKDADWLNKDDVYPAAWGVGGIEGKRGTPPKQAPDVPAEAAHYAARQQAEKDGRKIAELTREVDRLDATVYDLVQRETKAKFEIDRLRKENARLQTKFVAAHQAAVVADERAMERAKLRYAAKIRALEDALDAANRGAVAAEVKKGEFIKQIVEALKKS